MGSLHIFSLTFNPIALTFLLCGVIDILLITYIRYKKITSLTAVWFMVFCFLAIINAISQAFLSMSANDQTFVFWSLVNNFSIIMTGIFVLFFVISFVGKEEYLKKFSVISCLLVVVYTLIFLMFSTDKIYSYNVAQAILTPWGRMPYTGEFIIVITIYFAVITVASLFLLIRFYATLKEENKKQQAKLVIAGFMILLVGSIIGQGLIPQLLHIPAFPVSIILNVVLSSFVAYSLSKYGGEVFTMNSVAEKLLQIIPNAVLVVDNNATIEHINPSTETLLHFSSVDLVGKPLRSIFPNDVEYLKFTSTILVPLIHDTITQLHDIQVISSTGESIGVDVHATVIKNSGSELNQTLLIITSIQSVKDQSKELEQKFKEIEEQKTELERLNKSMIDRELRMVELKKENEELKSNLSQNK